MKVYVCYVIQDKDMGDFTLPEKINKVVFTKDSLAKEWLNEVKSDIKKLKDCNSRAIDEFYTTGSMKWREKWGERDYANLRLYSDRGDRPLDENTLRVADMEWDKMNRDRENKIARKNKAFLKTLPSFQNGIIDKHVQKAGYDVVDFVTK